MAGWTCKATITADDSRFTSAMKRAESSMGGLQKGTSRLTSGFKGFAIGGAAMAIVSKAMNVVGNSIGAAVTRFDTLNKYPVVMRALGYSAQDTAKSTKILKTGIDGLPTSLDEVTKSAQQMAPLTGSATKAAQSAIALNNAFLASGASTADASRGMQQYTQMLSTGKVDLMSYRTLQETMPIALRKVANAFGFTGKSAENDLFKALQSGKITTEQLNDKFIQLNKGVGGFAELAKKNSAGIGTSFANLKNTVVKNLSNLLSAIDQGFKNAGFGSIATVLDNMKVAINGAFTKITPIVTSAVTTILNTIKKLEPVFKAVSEGIKGAFSNDMFTTAIVAITSFIGIAMGVQKLIPVFTSLKNTFMALKAAASAGKDLDALRTAMGALAEQSKLAAVAQTILNSAILTNPYVLAAVALAALVAGLVYFFGFTKTGQQAWQGFTQWLGQAWQNLVTIATGVWNSITQTFSGPIAVIQGIWNGIVVFFQNLWNAIVTTATGVWNSFLQGMAPIVASIQNLWNALVEFFSVLWQTIVTVATTVWNGIIMVFTPIIQTIMSVWNTIQPFFVGLWTAITAYLSTAWNNIVTIASTVWNVLVTVISTVWNVISTVVSTAINVVAGIIRAVTAAIQGDWSGAWNAIKGVATTIWNGIKSVITTVINGIMGVITAVLNGIKGVWNNTWNGIKAIATAIWNGIKGTISNVINGIRSVITSVLNGIKSTWNSVWNGIKSLASSTWNAIKSVVTSGINAVKSVITSVMNGVKSVISNVWNNIKSIFRNGANAMRSILQGVNLISIGRNIIQGLVNGINGAMGAVRNAVSKIADAIPSGIKKFLHIGSPSRLMRDEVGQWIPAGIAVGMEQNKRTVEHAALTLSRAAMFVAPAIDSNKFDTSLSNLTNRANANIQGSFNQKLQLSGQPMVVNLALGGNEYSTFVTDISKEQDTQNMLRKKRF